MTRVSLPARTAADWRPLLAQPDLQWRAGRASHALAHSWQHAAESAPGGLPAEVRAVLGTRPVFERLDALLVIPQHVTPFPGASAGSHTDVLVLARAVDGLAVIAVEAKASEPFGPTVGAWRAEHSPDTDTQLDYLCEVLGIDHVPDAIPAQLVHRAAAALIEADAFAATHAVLLVHGFARPTPAGAPVTLPAGFDDFAAFVALFGVQAVPGTVATVARAGGRWLHFAWAQGAPVPTGPPSPDVLLRDQLTAILGGEVESISSTLLTYGDPVEVLVRADPHAVHVEVPVVEWRGHTPVLTGERRASFPREGVTRLGGDAPFIEAIYTARAERVARFRTCAECGERNPPEWMHSATLCTRCATRDR